MCSAFKNASPNVPGAALMLYIRDVGIAAHVFGRLATTAPTCELHGIGRESLRALAGFLLFTTIWNEEGLPREPPVC